MDATKILPREDSTPATRSASTLAGIDPELHRQAARRLGAVALVFGLGVLGGHTAFKLADYLVGGTVPDPFYHVIAGLSAAVGIAVYLWSRRGRIPADRFPGVAFGFEVLVGALIAAGDWGWEHNRAEELLEIAGALGIAVSDLGPRFVDPINALGISLIRMDGAPWLGVWILFYPMIVPTTPRRTLWASIVTALVGLGVLALSVAINGVPDGVGPWLVAFLAGTCISLAVLVLTAYFGSRAVYRLQRDLSKARRMGSYQLVERIGAGGMGEVWRAEHRMLARPAAIKLIRPDATGMQGASARTALRRFEREAQATAALTSPHTIEVYDFGITDGGDFYYVMSLLEGFDLKTLVERFGPVPAERAVFLLRQACHSLWDAHLRGLTHRDIKPANIFAGTRLPEHDFVTVLDFGLVKGSAGTGDIQLTEAGTTTGTPAFLAPEMARTGAGDGRSDLYSLGCVAYWLLTGSLVFEASSAVDMILKHVQEEPVPPSRRSELPVPAELDRVVLDCLAKDPAARPPSAEALIARLDASLGSLPPWTRERAAAWWRTLAPERAAGPLS